MKKTMKKIIAAVLTAAMAMSVGIPAFASENVEVNENLQAVSEKAVYMNASEKMNFANQMDVLYQNAVNNGTMERASREEIDLLIEQVTFASGAERKALVQKLSEYGVYVYETESDFAIAPLSDSGDVTLVKPTVVYEATDKTWTVTCGGNWLNTSWSTVLAGNVGGLDGFGVGYTNISGTYNSAVVRSSAYITDQDRSNTNRTTNRSDGDGSKGFGFRLQDRRVGSTYVGYIWYGACTYDYRFGSYSGIATAYYIHTYDSASIESVSFEVNKKTGGLTVNVSNSNESFVAYSNDTRFGVY